MNWIKLTKETELPENILLYFRREQEPAWWGKYTKERGLVLSGKKQKPLSDFTHYCIITED